MFSATHLIRCIRRFTGVTTALAACALIGASSTPGRCASMPLFGMNLAWLSYGGAGFGSSYNSSAVDTYLNELKYNDHMNIVRVWLFEGNGGLQFSGGNVTGVDGTYLNNIKDFCNRATSKGLTTYATFMNYMDIQSYPSYVNNSAVRASLINNAIVPTAKALSGSGYWMQYDLINEGNVATKKVSWSDLRTFCSQAVSALRSNGVNNWVTMSDQYAPDFTQYFSSTVGGLGFNFYDYHSYNDQGSLAVSPSNVGGAPLILGEYGPGSPWNNRSQAQNQATLDSFMNNASSKGYYGVLAWCYLPDGSNWQLRGNSLMGNISWWGANFGH